MLTKNRLGPKGLHVILDSSEIFPDDPGQGTPAMVYLRGQSATYWCALNEGEVDGEELSTSQQAFLESIEDEVAEFIETHSN
jgi:hypothetical protein